MTRLLLRTLVVAWFVPASLFCQEAKAPTTLPQLRERIGALVTHSRFDAALWGVKIVSLDTGKLVFEYNPQKLLSPASNCKLYTVALALDRLGADYRIKTSLYAESKPDSRGTLKGDLIVYGRGDPSINTRLHGGSLLAALAPLVAALTNAGVRSVTGDLVADDSFFRGPEFGSGWAWDDMQYYYGAELSALTINDNLLQVAVKPGDRAGLPCQLTLSPATPLLILQNRTQTGSADVRRTISFYRPLNENVIYVTGQMPLGTNSFTDDVTFHKPARFFGEFLKEALARSGVKVKGAVRTAGWLDRQTPLDCSRLVELGSADSPPLRVIAREVQKPSQNLYTDLLLAHAGETVRSAADRPEATSEELGIRELNKFLTEAGIAKEEVYFEEGSGLSRNNLTTANATVKLLEFMSRHPCAGDYLESLPVAGKDGTLRSRMRNTPAAGNVRAKTGSLRWASSLSGYVTTAAGERLAFSLMLNRHTNPAIPNRAELDAIAVLLASFEGRSGE